MITFKNNTFFTTMLVMLLSLLVNTTHAAETVTYYHNDALGSPVAATDEAGNLLWREAYKPYGERILKQDNDTNDTWYTGKQEDKTTGLSYFGARWYDPVIGRFMSIDPVGFKEGNIHSFNRYAYANNNPYKFIDPDGEESVRNNSGQLINMTPVPGFSPPMRTADMAVSAIGLATGVGEFKALVTWGIGKFAAKNTTILGENMMQRVIPYADKTGARTLPFGTTKEKWSKLTPKQRWKLNDGTLRSRINEGDNFKYIGRDLGRNPSARKKFDLTGSELQRLKGRGVPYETVTP